MEDGILRGYRWFDIISSLTISNNAKKEAVKKINDVFEQLIKIGQRVVLPITGEKALHATFFTYDVKYFSPYRGLAEKIMNQYSKKEYPELFSTAHILYHKQSLV
jgi:hypothetical protein